MSTIDASEIRAALLRGSQRYFAECRARVDPFVDKHFRYPGVWRTNRQAFGLDLLRAPFNLFWAPVYVLSRLLLFACQRFGWSKLSGQLSRLPSGLNTQVQAYLVEATCRELLAGAAAADQPYRPDRLRECLREALDEIAGTAAEHHALSSEVDALVADSLHQYSLTRTASSDIANSLFSTLFGAFAFQKFTPGGLAIGLSVATLVANELAAEEFIFGKTLGALYYQLYPTTPSLAVQLGSVALAMAGLATLASLSGLLTDPLQRWLGLHKRRLTKMIDHLERDFEERTLGSFRPKDQYLARVLELVDAAKSGLG